MKGWLQTLITRLWFWGHNYKPDVRLLFEKARRHRHNVHHDNDIHLECSECLRLAEAMMQVYNLTPTELLHNSSAAGTAREVASAIVGRKDDKWKVN